MPELPEVETTRRGIEPHVLGRRVEQVIVREPRLRWPVPGDLPQRMAGQVIDAVERRAKYLLLRTAAGSALMHLGMSGSLRVVPAGQAPGKHDHLDIRFADTLTLRFNDPRRFGCCLWLEPGEQHPLLGRLGPEPLSAEFDGAYLYGRARGRKGPVKPFLMDQNIVVGVGNIYAAEALFAAGIHPQRPAGRVSQARYERLAEEVKQVLTFAIGHGGTTLRDFVGGDGKPGYFAQELSVYGREGQPCKRCGKTLKNSRLGQRSTVYCVTCQR
ncbi:bifunctional DNA-formamidopyrimidine glycosylase/DNA-(apurinic or apyrimidinic site) lyase [Mangrovimicrobium sediminis]|uniref:Formamidopyrimidine-DNA glycosylase n=1 Tax=Mangrovimicrobium sediminis TaxID=2562682 RepID=A0A4Z0LZQ0_9GAMM|nr:bifunctional DNA-formamidopyrimidine glycosylase/DNA-(apurinic or apyrimidinic site) lyase [Haliea sp. SAOS-164]TGD72741.1 bifunctional DNA-formamidopyrimidine glycosylase/DNA-(apurinic or apyrimidinic site) lyase [Haliea sp. SAOS-164]